MDNNKKHRLMALSAAALLILTLFVLIWTALMTAPTYPEGDLYMSVYSYKFDGTIDEWNRIGRLVGVKVPPPIPEQTFIFMPMAFIVLAIMAFISAFKKKWVVPTIISISSVLLFLSIWAQYSLYVFGHSLDPDRPLRFLQDFTPPLIGWITTGRIITYHFPNVGSFTMAAALGLLIFCWWKNRKETILDHA